jgi:hypothetical protein
MQIHSLSFAGYLLHQTVHHSAVKIEIGNCSLRKRRPVELPRKTPAIAILGQYSTASEWQKRFSPPEDAVVAIYTTEDPLDVIWFHGDN